MGFHDFAGSTVVHTIGGFIALAGAIVLGPRLGRKFKRDGGAPMLPHDLTIAVSGGLILWFGWYGFNPGSTLSAMDFVGIGRVATNTTLAACAAGLTSIIYGYFMTKKWDAGYTTNGFLAGLVAITCPCYWVSPTGAVLLGGIAGVLVILGVDLLEWLRIDDPIGAVPVHGFCGIWGTLSLGLFACGQIWRDRADLSRQQRSAQGPFLWRRHAGAGGAGHRQRLHHAGDVRGGHGRDARGQRNGNPSLAGRGGTLRHGPARARHLGLSGIRDFTVRCPSGLATQIAAAERALATPAPKAMARTSCYFEQADNLTSEDAQLRQSNPLCLRWTSPTEVQRRPRSNAKS